jgi:uncharacterized protein YbjT (DUF2867 family)
MIFLPDNAKSCVKAGIRMRILIFGATGMVGQGALRECLLDPQVEEIQAVGRSATGERGPKLREIVQRKFWRVGTLGIAR